MKQDVRAAVRSLTVALGLGLALTGCGSGMDHGGMDVKMTGGGNLSSSAAGREADVSFAQMMIEHHEQAVKMSDLALAPAAGASPQVVQLATAIKGAQAPEIKQMETWLTSWGASRGHHMAMDHPMPGLLTEAQMTALAAAKGPAFDKLWLAGMIEHHRGAVSMATDVLRTTADPGVKSLAAAIITAQNKEITTMTGLLAQPN